MMIDFIIFMDDPEETYSKKLVGDIDFKFYREIIFHQGTPLIG